MERETIKVNQSTKFKFDKLQLDLKIKKKKLVTQDELVNMLMNVFKEYSKVKKL